jgi:hypothetical protein
MIKVAQKLEKVDSKLFIWLMFLYPFYILVISYIAHSYFNVTSNPGFASFITYVIVIGATPFVVYIVRWYFKGFMTINKFSRKFLTILFYGISFAMFFMLLLGHMMKEYKLH